MILSVSSSSVGTKRRAMVIIMANSCTGTCSTPRGLSSRSRASVSWVGEVEKVSVELARISRMIRRVTNTLLRIPCRVIFKNPS